MKNYLFFIIVFLVAFSMVTGLTAQAQDPLFTHCRFDYQVGKDPRSIACADFNNDTFDDMAITIFENHDVVVLFGGGDGIMSEPVRYPVVDHPGGITIIDYNHDDVKDLAVTHEDSGLISLLQGDGDGTFTSDTPISGGSAGRWISTFDATTDEIPDLITVDYGISGIVMHPGLASGGFGPPIHTFIDTEPLYPVVGDFDEDGQIDIAILTSSDNLIRIFGGDGAGGFSLIVALDPGNKKREMVAGDFNNDGHLDIALTTFYYPIRPVLYLNLGQANFQLHELTQWDLMTGMLACADMDGDQKDDLLVNCFGFDDVLTVIRQTESGLDEIWDKAPLGGYYVGMFTGDFNHDGCTDIVSANWEYSTVSVLLNHGNEHFVQPPDIPGVTDVSFIQAVDLNDDNYTDILLSESTILGCMNDGFGLLSTKFQADTEGTTTAVASDFTGDDLVDIIVTDCQMTMGPVPTPTPTPPARNPDSSPALHHQPHAASGSRDFYSHLILYKNMGNGEFDKIYTDGLGIFSFGINSADFNDDSFQDLLINNMSSSYQEIYLNDGSGFFYDASFDPPYGAYIAEPADMDRDGLPDMVLLDRHHGDLYVMLNQGNCEFSIPDVYPVSRYGSDLLLDDFNGDLCQDVALIAENQSGSDHISILLNDTAGGLGDPQHYILPDRASDLGKVDANHDGHIDLAVIYSSGGYISIYLNDGSGTFTTNYLKYGAVKQIHDAVGTDLNRDGFDELVVGGKSGTVLLFNAGGTPPPNTATPFPIPSPTPPPPSPTYVFTSTPTQPNATATATSSPTHSPTPRPTAIFTEEPTSSPTAPGPTPPSACDFPGVTLSMPTHHFSAGSVCSLTAFLCGLPQDVPADNQHSQRQTEMNSPDIWPFFLVLETAGAFFFYPEWDTHVDWVEMEIPPEGQWVEMIPQFLWPDGADAGSAVLYGVITDPEMTVLIGNVGIWEFMWD